MKVRASTRRRWRCAWFGHRRGVCSWTATYLHGEDEHGFVAACTRCGHLFEPLELHAGLLDKIVLVEA
jgi:hypothetical protein